MADYNSYLDPNLSAIYGSDPLGQLLGQPSSYDPTQNAAPPQAPPPPDLSNQNRTLMSTMLNPSAPTAQDQTPIDISGWKPHHTSTLGKIADIGLALFGMPFFPFAKHTRNENIKEAMEGFTNDPLGTIRKMAQIPGMRKEALNLFNDYQQLHKNDTLDAERYAYYHGGNENAALKSLGSFYGAFANSPDPSASYQRMLGPLRNMAKMRGMTDEDIQTYLPDTYNPDVGTTVAFGAIDPENQVSLNETARAHRESERERIASINQTGAYREARLGQIDSHNRKMEGIAQERANKMGKGSVTYVNTKYGPGEVSPDGKLMRVQVGDTDHFYMKTGANQWRHVKAKKHDYTKDASTLQNEGTAYDYEPDEDEDDN